jgi:glycosyltransferase involved in cell wall biosynthesis
MPDIANSGSQRVPVAVVMITLNEAHNLEAVLDNIQGWAEQVFIVDSYSSDATIEIALRRGVHVVQRAFRGFGDQWNFALETLPISSKWTMKLDPDERLSDELKASVAKALKADESYGYSLTRRLWFMGKPLPIKQSLVRIWRTGECKFTDVAVNEHPVVSGDISSLSGFLEHLDSPDLQHWYDKQNKYTTAEALIRFRGDELAAKPALLGTSLQRRMWFKANFFSLPFRYPALFLYHYVYLSAWRAGRVGCIWAKLRVEVYRATEYKWLEMKITGTEPIDIPHGAGLPDQRVAQYD